MQPRRTVPVVCIEAESVWPWQATQPVLVAIGFFLRFAQPLDPRCRDCGCPSSSAHRNAHAALDAKTDGQAADGDGFLKI